MLIYKTVTSSHTTFELEYQAKLKNYKKKSL